MIFFSTIILSQDKIHHILGRRIRFNILRIANIISLLWNKLIYNYILQFINIKKTVLEFFLLMPIKGLGVRHFFVLLVFQKTKHIRWWHIDGNVYFLCQAYYQPNITYLMLIGPDVYYLILFYKDVNSLEQDMNIIINFSKYYPTSKLLTKHILLK